MRGILALILMVTGCSTPSKQIDWLDELVLERSIDSCIFLSSQYPFIDTASANELVVYRFGTLDLAGCRGTLSVYRDLSLRITRYEWYVSAPNSWGQPLALSEGTSQSERFDSATESKFEAISRLLESKYGKPDNGNPQNLISWRRHNLFLENCTDNNFIRLSKMKSSPNFCSLAWPFTKFVADSFYISWTLPQDTLAYLKQWGPDRSDSLGGNSPGVFTHPKSLWGIPGRQIAAYDSLGKILRIGWTTDESIYSGSLDRINSLLFSQFGSDTVRKGNSTIWKSGAAEYRLSFKPVESFVFVRTK